MSWAIISPELGLKVRLFVRNASPEPTPALDKPAGFLFLTSRYGSCPAFQRINPVTFRHFEGCLKHDRKYTERSLVKLQVAGWCQGFFRH